MLIDRLKYITILTIGFFGFGVPSTFEISAQEFNSFGRLPSQNKINLDINTLFPHFDDFSIGNTLRQPCPTCMTGGHLISPDMSGKEIWDEYDPCKTSSKPFPRPSRPTPQIEPYPAKIYPKILLRDNQIGIYNTTSTKLFLKIDNSGDIIHLSPNELLVLKNDSENIKSATILREGRPNSNILLASSQINSIWFDHNDTEWKSVASFK